MKNISNLTFKLQLSEKEFATTGLLLALCLKNPPPGGFDFETMGARFRVVAAVDKALPGGELVLEDADFVTAVSAVRAMKWGALDPDILTFGAQFGI